MTTHLNEMGEICCPDCRKPLSAIPDPDDENRCQLLGCLCGQKEYMLPDFVVIGFGEGPLLLYKNESSNPSAEL